MPRSKVKFGSVVVTKKEKRSAPWEKKQESGVNKDKVTSELQQQREGQLRKETERDGTPYTLDEE
ncbi:hypothetical protein EYF80_015788 [Liparis tanakae]|uniref:Uncharacterized protein n=1 Tax=Liparis tanakae TaxID=230148 RepID=A0A4Z2I7F0_9TELE|nr:hypothetical protein EYF80_015788 [Liparis tanakae]